MPVPVTFVVSGKKRDGTSRGRAPVASAPTGTVKQSVELTARRAAGDGDVRMEAVPGEDAVVFHIAGGPSLWLHPEHAREMLQAQHDPARERGAKEELRTGEIRVPARLQWRLEDAVPTRGAMRGFLGDVLLEAIDIITGIAVDKAADFVASKVVDRFDSRVVEQVYKLRRRRVDAPARPGAVARPRRRRAVAGAGARHVLGDERDVRQVVDGPSATRPQPVQGVRRPRLRARPPHAWRQSDRERDHARQSPPRRVPGSIY